MGPLPDGYSTTRYENGRFFVYMVRVCPDGLGPWWWEPLDGTPGDPPVTTTDLVPGAIDEARKKLTKPTIHTPGEWFPDGMTFVQIPTVFWVGEGEWTTVEATAQVPGLSVTVTAEPLRLEIDPGDGSDLVVCQGEPQELPRGGDPEQYTACSHVYRHSSSTAENGETFPVTATIVWHVTWSASTGEQADLGEMTSTGPTHDLPVGEVQGIVTG